MSGARAGEDTTLQGGSSVEPEISWRGIRMMIRATRLQAHGMPEGIS